MKSLKILGIIPARYSASRFPGKPLTLIGGKTMIERVWRGCSESTKLFDLVVATDDKRILEEVRKFGGKVLMTDPNHQNGTNRAIEVYEKYTDPVDWVINIQGDEPLINHKILDHVVDLIFHTKDADIITLVRKTDNTEDIHSSNVVKCVFDESHKALYFSRSAIPYNRSNQHKEYYQHIGLYAYRSDALQKIKNMSPSTLELAESLEQLRWLEKGMKIYIGITDYISHGVDVPGDVEKIERILQASSVN